MACISVLETSGYYMSLRCIFQWYIVKDIIFLLNFAVFLQQPVIPLYVPFRVLEYYVLVEEVHQ